MRLAVVKLHHTFIVVLSRLVFFLLKLLVLEAEINARVVALHHLLDDVLIASPFYHL